MILNVNAIISLNNIKQLIVVMVKYCVLFEVRIEFLNMFRRASALKGYLSSIYCLDQAGFYVFLLVCLKIAESLPENRPPSQQSGRP
jgi:hypothetical protein